MTDQKPRSIYLSTLDLKKLNDACAPLVEAFGCRPYLVGSVRDRADFRDVDVRLILADDEFDHLFAGKPHLWSYLCSTICDRLQRETGLPVDFQIQRRTEANEKHDGYRGALGMKGRLYAGGGDATNFGGDAA